MTYEEFIERYPAQGPYRPENNGDELRKLARDDGVQLLHKPPVDVVMRKVPDKKGDEGCHLWVLNEEGIPYILERAGVASRLASGVVKHTNLTGGAAASCGGELWLDPNVSEMLYVNGCSGRYGPRTARQLEDAEEVFKQLGFDVRGFGWDEDADRPAVVLR